MNKKELLQFVRQKSRCPSIKFPREIDFQENNHVITLTMRDSVTKNMQDDSAAFEGWVLCLKACMDTESLKCCLRWQKPANHKNKEHYQRFLYRVDRFNNIFGGSNGWFFIDDESKEFLIDLEIKDSEKFFLNSPSTENKARINNETKNIESRLENEIVIQQNSFKDLKQLCPATLHRQLPVGLFHTKVAEGNAIFPSKHSAIDLWGTSGADLYILELKAERNRKVGVLSELFFYTMVLQDEQAGRFTRESDGIELLRNTSQIKSFILAPKLHPFITQKVFHLLNEKLKNRETRFEHIEFKYEEIGHNLRFRYFKKIQEC